MTIFTTISSWICTPQAISTLVGGFVGIVYAVLSYQSATKTLTLPSTSSSINFIVQSIASQIVRSVIVVIAFAMLQRSNMLALEYGLCAFVISLVIATIATRKGLA